MHVLCQQPWLLQTIIYLFLFIQVETTRHNHLYFCELKGPFAPPSKHFRYIFKVSRYEKICVQCHRMFVYQFIILRKEVPLFLSMDFKDSPVTKQLVYYGQFHLFPCAQVIIKHCLSPYITISVVDHYYTHLHTLDTSSLRLVTCIHIDGRQNYERTFRHIFITSKF